jgi:hypothetical protein
MFYALRHLTIDATIGTIFKNDCQPVLGGMGGEPSIFARTAAQETIIPDFVDSLHSKLKGQWMIETTNGNSVDRNKNIIAYGGWAISDISKNLLLKNELKYTFGLIYTDKDKFSGGKFHKEENGKRYYIKFHVSDEDIEKIRLERIMNLKYKTIESYKGTDLGWVLVDRFNEIVISEPGRSRVNKRYIRDSAIITYYKSPLNESNRDIIAICGTRYVGTYLGHLCLRTPEYAKLLAKHLSENELGGEAYFQVPIEFNIKNNYNLNDPSKIELLGKPIIKKIYKF